LIFDPEYGAVTGVKIKRKRRPAKGKQKPSTNPDNDVAVDIKQDTIEVDGDAGWSDSNEVQSNELEADVVVCATGRRNQVAKWLKEIDAVGEGDEVPQEFTSAGISYVTSLWRAPTGTITNLEK
jgi:hypothetical protein